MTQQKHVSDATARLIDEEVRRLIDEGEARAREILAQRRHDLDALAQALLEYETLSGEEVRTLLKGEAIFRPEQSDSPKGHGSRTSMPTAGKRLGPEKNRGLDPEPQPGR